MFGGAMVNHQTISHRNYVVVENIELADLKGFTVGDFVFEHWSPITGEVDFVPLGTIINFTKVKGKTFAVLDTRELWNVDYLTLESSE